MQRRQVRAPHYPSTNSEDGSIRRGPARSRGCKKIGLCAIVTLGEFSSMAECPLRSWGLLLNRQGTTALSGAPLHAPDRRRMQYASRNHCTSHRVMIGLLQEARRQVHRDAAAAQIDFRVIGMYERNERVAGRDDQAVLRRVVLDRNDRSQHTSAGIAKTQTNKIIIEVLVWPKGDRVARKEQVFANECLCALDGFDTCELDNQLFVMSPHARQGDVPGFGTVGG